MGIQINGQTDTISAVDNNFSLAGNVSVGGVLTYEDVTSVDAVGLSTFQAGIHVTGGLVGIGTDNPVRKLDVDGTSRFTDYIYGNSTTNKIYVNDDLALSATKKLYFDTGSNTYIHEESADNLAVVTGGAEAIRIDSNGRLLVGATSSYGSANSDDLTIGDRTQSEVGITLGATVASAIRFADAGNVSAGMIQYVHNSGGTDYLNFYTNGSNERLRITSDGNALFGGTAVSQTNRQLVVGSNAEANLAIETHNTSASETANIRFYRSRGTAASPTPLVDNDVISQLVFYGHDGTDYAHAAATIKVECDGTVASNQMPGAMSFYTNAGGSSATERLRITSAGYVGINQSTPQTTFHSTGTTNGQQATFGIDDSGLKISTFQKTDNDAGVILDAQKSSNGTLTFATAGTERFRITSTGDVRINVDGSGGASSQQGILRFYRTAYSNDMLDSRIVFDTSGGASYSTNSVYAAVIAGKRTTEDNGSSELSFYTCNTSNSFAAQERLKITSAGYVTKPNTPYFSVQGSPNLSNFTNYDNSVHTFGTINSNNGSHYNNSTGRFTAPVAGFYWFSGGIWSSNSDNSAGTYLFNLVRDNSGGGGELQFAGANHRINKNQLTVSAGIYMTVGQSVRLWYNGSIQGSTPRNYFSGYLVG